MLSIRFVDGGAAGVKEQSGADGRLAGWSLAPFSQFMPLLTA